MSFFESVTLRTISRDCEVVVTHSPNPIIQHCGLSSCVMASVSCACVLAGGRSGKPRDQISDDGYYSAQHGDANNLSTAQVLSAQYLEKYPEERHSTGRRSPATHRRRHSGRSSVPADMTYSPEMSRHSSSPLTVRSGKARKDAKYRDK